MARNAAPEPWEKQPGESDKAYQAFTVYRDQGAGNRSQRRVGQTLGKSSALMSEWSSRWKWVERAEAWDAELDRQARVAEAKALKEMKERHIKMAVAIQTKALQRLNAMNISELSPQDTIRYMDIAVKIERLTRGEATEKQEIGGEVKQQHEYSFDAKNAIKDKETADLACTLFERLRMGEANAGRAGDVRDEE